MLLHVANKTWRLKLEVAAPCRETIDFQKSRSLLTKMVDKQLEHKATCRYDGHAYVHKKSQA